MNVDQKRMDVLSSNLANIGSTGYKKKDINFTAYRDMLVDNLGNRRHLGSLPQGLIIHNFSLNMANGATKHTQNPFDFALNDLHFFTLEDEEGRQLLTRNGSFALDEQNFLVNQDGHRVLGEGGAINIADTQAFEVDQEGNITLDGQFLDRFQITSVAHAGDLMVTNTPYYLLREGAQPPEEGQIEVKQGFLEQSNVNGIALMTEMISVMRSYEANQRAVQLQDEALSRTVNQVGKTNI